MADVVAVLIDEDWFQVYDNLNKFTEKYVASGLYWNYFYHTWKTVSSSPFHNAVVFVKSTANIDAPDSLTYTVASKDVSSEGQTVINLDLSGAASLAGMNFVFVQTEDATEKGVGVQRYGSILIPSGVTTVDLDVTDGTTTLSGTVTTAAYDDDYGNYIVITDSKGFTTKYAHLESMNVSAGQTVRHGEIIGKTGSTGAVTGSHLHLECLSDGEYYNPLFYFENGNGSIYGTTDPIGGSGDVAALIAEAENYLGYPYVWGGSNPSTSFDCSGFVCYVLTHSGYCNMPRTTAQGIYNQCTPISASEARAGDIIFFTGTYNSGNPVTHVGI